MTHKAKLNPESKTRTIYKTKPKTTTSKICALIFLFITLVIGIAEQPKKGLIQENIKFKVECKQTLINKKCEETKNSRNKLNPRVPNENRNFDFDFE